MKDERIKERQNERRNNERLREEGKDREWVKNKQWKLNTEKESLRDKTRKRKAMILRPRPRKRENKIKVHRKRVIENIVLWVTINFLYLFAKHLKVFLFYSKQEACSQDKPFLPDIY